jgi:hypothetical protein
LIGSVLFVVSGLGVREVSEKEGRLFVVVSGVFGGIEGTERIVNTRWGGEHEKKLKMTKNVIENGKTSRMPKSKHFEMRDTSFFLLKK